MQLPDVRTVLSIAWVFLLLFISYCVYNLYQAGHIIVNVNILQHNFQPQPKSS